MRPEFTRPEFTRPDLPGVDVLTPSEDERLARVVLSRGTEPGDLITASLVRQLGPRRAVEVQCQPRRNSGLHDRLTSVDPVRELEEADRLGIRFVIPGDPEWPRAFDDLETPQVQQMGGVPMGVWVRGPGRLSVLDQSVAIVGSRAATVYGTTTARDIAAVVARAGVPVVSGGAMGIDRAAHDGALAVDGATAAVLACGLDRCYPMANQQLLSHLAAEHLVASELPPRSDPTRVRFLARNRLIAALGRATVLVEAALRSGALNTAHWADELSRDVLGVPGPLTSVSSQGVHQRIRQGGAVLVTHGMEVLEHIGAAGEHLVEVPRGPERPRDRLGALDQRVLEVVPRSEPVDITVVAREAAQHVRDVDGALRRLESGGFVEFTGDGWRQDRLARAVPT